MQSHLNGLAESGYSAIPLQLVVNDLVKIYIPFATCKKSHIINDIDHRLTFSAENKHVIEVLDEILETVVQNSKNGEIHISADKFRDVTIVKIEERNNNNGYALSYSIGAIQPSAFIVGGHIDISGSQNRITTISFCFPNQQAA
jgi:hypothetical protein